MLVSVAFCANTVVARKSPKSFILIFALLLTNQKKSPSSIYRARALSAPRGDVVDFSEYFGRI